MSFYYLDSSVWVKRYYQEVGTDWVKEFFEQNQPISCSPVGFFEVMATLYRKGKAKELPSEDIEKKRLDLKDDWELFIQIKLTEAVANQTEEAIKNFSLRGADSIHLASALSFKKRLGKERNLIFITSDQELKEAARLSGFEVLDPSDQKQ